MVDGRVHLPPACVCPPSGSNRHRPAGWTTDAQSTLRQLLVRGSVISVAMQRPENRQKAGGLRLALRAATVAAFRSGYKSSTVLLRRLLRRPEQWEAGCSQNGSSDAGRQAGVGLHADQAAPWRAVAGPSGTAAHLGGRQHAGGAALRDEDAAGRQLLSHHHSVELLGVELQRRADSRGKPQRLCRYTENAVSYCFHSSPSARSLLCEPENEGKKGCGVEAKDKTDRLGTVQMQRKQI